MSRIGKQPIAVPSSVTAKLEGRTLKVKGPKGEMDFTAPEQVTIEQSDGQLTVAPADQSKTARSMWGMSRTRLNNLITGVTDGYSRTLEITGVGYRAAVKGKALQLNVGYSHEVLHPIPSDLTVEVSGAKQEVITVSGVDKQRVGQFAAEVRDYRPPEPYQGKGIRYQGEYIFRKEGKKK